MPRLYLHHTPPFGVLSGSQGWPRLQEGRDLPSSLREAEKSRRKDSWPGAVLGLGGIRVGQKLGGPCSFRASQRKLVSAPLLELQILAVCL